MDKQNQANKNMNENLVKGNVQERQFGQEANKACQKDLPQGQNKLEKGAQGIAREQDRDLVDQQARPADAQMKGQQGINRDVRLDQCDKQEIGKDQEWAQRREKDAGIAAQDRHAHLDKQAAQDRFAPQDKQAAQDRHVAQDKQAAQDRHFAQDKQAPQKPAQNQMADKAKCDIEKDQVKNRR